MIDELKNRQIVEKVGGAFKLSALIQKRLAELLEGSRPLIENTFPTKVGFEFSWKRNKPPLDAIVVSDGQSKQGTFGCVLSITKI